MYSLAEIKTIIKIYRNIENELSVKETHFLKWDIDNASETLTENQKILFELLKDNYTHAEIASELNISISTSKRRTKFIYRKILEELNKGEIIE